MMRELGIGNWQCVVGGFPACRRRTAPLAERDALSVEGELGMGGEEQFSMTNDQ
jgi:hypothetical protein